MSQEARPPYVTFETRQVEDRTASIEAGHYVAKDVHYAIITPSGSKDRLEKIAEEWLKDIEAAVREERFPAQWAEGYKAGYKAFLEGKELPEDGTPILTWPPLSPAQVRTIIDADVRTVEDLAAANEATLTRIGIGGRAFKQQAQAWLDTVKDTGKVAAELTALRKENENLKKRDEERDAQIKELTNRLDAMAKVKEDA